MIVVTGATGQLGERVVEGLLKRLSSAQIRVSVRHSEQAEYLKHRGVGVCKGDFADPATLTEAFDGAEQVLIVSVNKFGEEAVRQHGHAIQAAKDAGAKRISISAIRQRVYPLPLHPPGITRPRKRCCNRLVLLMSPCAMASTRNRRYTSWAG